MKASSLRSAVIWGGCAGGALVFGTVALVSPTNVGAARKTATTTTTAVPFVRVLAVTITNPPTPPTVAPTTLTPTVGITPTTPAVVPVIVPVLESTSRTSTAPNTSNTSNTASTRTSNPTSPGVIITIDGQASPAEVSTTTITSTRPHSKKSPTTPLLVNGQPVTTLPTLPTLPPITVPTTPASFVPLAPPTNATAEPVPVTGVVVLTQLTTGPTSTETPKQSTKRRKNTTTSTTTTVADTVVPTNTEPAQVVSAAAPTEPTEVTPVYRPVSSSQFTIVNTAPPTTAPPPTVATTTTVPAPVTYTFVDPSSPVPDSNPRASEVIDWARSQLGVPYLWAGDGAESGGFDCSGLILRAWAQVGVVLPHQSQLQYSMTARISKADLQPGDLVFYGAPIHHVGLYIGDGKMIEAPRAGATVRISGIFRRDLVGAGRIIGQ